MMHLLDLWQIRWNIMRIFIGSITAESIKFVIFRFHQNDAFIRCICRNMIMTRRYDFILQKADHELT